VGLFRFATGAKIFFVGIEDVNITGKEIEGALIGEGIAEIRKSYVTGYITSLNGNVGGLVGWANDTSVISNSYANTIVKGSHYVGGLSGDFGCGIIYNSYSIGYVEGWPHIGGLVGGLANAKMFNSYTTSKVKSQVNLWAVGGLIGWSTCSIVYPYKAGCAVVTNSYFDQYLTGQTRCVGYYSGGTIDCYSINSSQPGYEDYWYHKENPPMNQWDFDKIWIEVPNDYPKLKWEIKYMK
jgi:hypothetical protein